MKGNINCLKYKVGDIETTYLGKELVNQNIIVRSKSRKHPPLENNERANSECFCQVIGRAGNKSLWPKIRG